MLKNKSTLKFKSILNFQQWHTPRYILNSNNFLISPQPNRKPPNNHSLIENFRHLHTQNFLHIFFAGKLNNEAASGLLHPDLAFQIILQMFFQGLRSHRRNVNILILSQTRCYVNRTNRRFIRRVGRAEFF